MKKIVVVILTVALAAICFVEAAEAGTLAELEESVNIYSSSGEIVDPDIKATLSELIVKAKVSGGDFQSEGAYRDAFIDVVNAFKGMGINVEAASHLIELAQP